MTYALTINSGWDYTHKEMNWMKYLKNIVTAYTKVLKPSVEVDKLSFMETFAFSKIEDIRNSLVQSGKYTEKQMSEILEGLDDLPEFNRD